VQGIRTIARPSHKSEGGGSIPSPLRRAAPRRARAIEEVEAALTRSRPGSRQPGTGGPALVPARSCDPEAERSLVVLFFDSEDDYRQGDEMLNAMPAGDTPGQRTSVTKYEVAMRMTP
jgi:hypothetical protein